ncbi:hypothetical protein CRE_09502 [Caenorhabditis remanei]|uniref:RING-type domain-containing protein n=1 Tax=Caenorhabditis remanei TaxID=31234 RepID=E3MIX2_CAERE|nr:hypothetical protein CRE_09502 [Caenorhabditis remanei]
MKEEKEERILINLRHDDVTAATCLPICLTSSLCLPSTNIGQIYATCHHLVVRGYSSVIMERVKNVLTEFYADPGEPEVCKKKEELSDLQRLLRADTHEGALRFAEESLYWKNRNFLSYPELTRLPIDFISCCRVVPRVHAFYRVIIENPNGYILTPCHANVHGYHRGDLRYIEVNDRTVTKSNEITSIVGKLFLGDIIGVTGLARLTEFKEFDVFQAKIDGQCIWMATNIQVYSRKILQDVTFSMLSNGTAVVKDHIEVMNVVNSESLPLEQGKLYTGTAFVPEKIFRHFTMDHSRSQKNAITAKCSKIHQYPIALGSIFNFEESPRLTEAFNIGVKAFSSYQRVIHVENTPNEIMETCVLMGYAAANSINNGRFDCRALPMENISRKGPILKFSIENPPENPTEGKWLVNCRIKIDCPLTNVMAIIETIVITDPRRLWVTARLSSNVPNNNKFDRGIHIVSQQGSQENQVLRTGFFHKTGLNDNGRRILEALYGGRAITHNYPTRTRSYNFPSNIPIALNQYQCNYVNMITGNIPIVVGCSPFGCGKSMTIVTAAVEIHKKTAEENLLRKYNKQLMLTQSNYASVNLVEIAKKIRPEILSDFKFVRYISEKNWKELSDDCKTEYDLPKLMGKVFKSWALGEKTSELLSFPHMENMINFLLDGEFLFPEYFTGAAFCTFKFPRFQKRYPSVRFLLEAFFILYEPDLVITTIDSLQALLKSEVLLPHSVQTIQIDEASQVPEYTFISLLTLFPNASYGLIGDIQQLPPYCETGLDGKLKDYGIGNTMERAVRGNMFPQAMLREVYRCHPRVTHLLSDLFYEGILIPGVTEDQRNEFLRKRPDLWPASQFPVMIVNNKEKGMRMGTSCQNGSEKELVKTLLNRLTEEHNRYQLQPSDIGVISFYAAQTSILTEALRGRGVKCGTVDAFQGSEREVIILCCTNAKISQFMQMSNRINVAMSRAKQATIIIGNVDGLRNARYWSDIVKEAEREKCVIQAESLRDIQIRSQPNRTTSQRQSAREYHNNRSQVPRGRKKPDILNQMSALTVSETLGVVQIPPSQRIPRNERNRGYHNNRTKVPKVSNQANISDEMKVLNVSTPTNPESSTSESADTLIMKKELEAARKMAEQLEKELKKVQEKFQEKEWNLCEICVSPYEQGVAEKTPKFLVCGHTFCQECLIHMTISNEIKCPTCRVASRGPAANLNTNFAIYKHL